MPVFFDNGDQVIYDYDPFFEWIDKNGISLYQLRKNRDFPEKGIERMKSSENLTIETLIRILYIVGAKDLNQIVRIRIKKRDEEVMFRQA